MCKWSFNYSDYKRKAKITLVSSTSIVEGGAHDVVLKDSTSGNGHQN